MVKALATPCRLEQFWSDKWQLTGKSYESRVDHKRCSSAGQSVGNSTPPGTSTPSVQLIGIKPYGALSNFFLMNAVPAAQQTLIQSSPSVGTSALPKLVFSIDTASSSRPAIGVSCKCWSPLQTDDTFLVDRSHPYLESIRCPKGYQYQMYKSTVENRSLVGRLFCVTGMKYQFAINKESERPAPIEEEDLPTRLIESDSESISSGYLSSSSFESSGEERRLVLNKQKVLDVWCKWNESVRIPKSSTPIQASEKAVLRKRAILSGESGKHMLAIKKNLNDKSKKEKTKAKTEMLDSFLDIQTPRVPRSNSENDVRRSNDDNTRDQQKRLSVPAHDAGLDINRRKQAESQSWKPKPFLTNSDSQLELRLLANDGRRSDNVRNISSSSHSVLPRYRVKVDSDPIVSQTKLAQQFSKSCAHFIDEWVPVDKSMSEFLANVDRENLASFLSFYDKMKSGDTDEKERRNPKSYKAAYF